MTYEEFIDFMNGLRKKSLPLKKPIKDPKAFTSKEEYMKYYGVVSFHR